MKKIADYTFDASWQQRALNLEPGDAYRVRIPIDDLGADEVVRFVGFDDVDNHYGIFVFEDADGKLLEVRGDFSGERSLDQLRQALAKV